MTTPQRDPSFDPLTHNIVSFREILEQNAGALNQLKQEFISRGWCIIKLPDNRVPKTTVDESETFWGVNPNKPPELFKFPIDVKSARESLKRFFDGPESGKVSVTGYSSVPHKESIHITTPDFRGNRGVSPPEVMEWCTLWDEVSVALVEILAKPVFGCSKATLAQRADLPIAWTNHHGMLDIAYYLNKQTTTLSHEIGFSTEDVNCVPHYDPGLLSISFFSSHEGLQLKDPQTGTWFAGPVNTVAGQEDLGVIWLGAAAVRASRNVFREGVHRVVYPQTPVSRITAWYEICTTDQVNEEINATPIPAGPLTLPNLPGSKQMVIKPYISKSTKNRNTNSNSIGQNQVERHYGVPASKSAPFIKIAPPLRPEVRLDGKRQIERHYGIPPSKSGAPFKNQYFRAKYSEDITSPKTADPWELTKDVQMNDA